MKNLTTDQAELIFSLFVAQNADRKISEFVENYSNDGKISELSIIRNVDVFICLSYGNWNYFSYDLSEFLVWTPNDRALDWGYWASFDIMKYISLEDKV